MRNDATRLTRDLLLGERVYLRPTDDADDASGRLPAYVYRAPDGLFVNLELVRQGYAAADKRDSHPHAVLFGQYEARAREARKGIWAERPQPPPVPRVAASTAGATRQPAAPPDITVYRTKTGKRYHREGCRSLSRSKIATPLSAAKLTLTPCQVCYPPE